MRECERKTEGDSSNDCAIVENTIYKYLGHKTFYAQEVNKYRTGRSLYLIVSEYFSCF